MTLSPKPKKWLNWMGLTSVPLRKLSADKLPIGIASGTLIDWADKRFLLTVSHAVDLNNTDWVIELSYDPGKGTEVYKPRYFMYLGEMSLNTGEMAEVDYAYCEIPKDVQPSFQLLTPRGPLSEKTPRHIFTDKDIVEPEAAQVYAFSGQVFPEFHEPSGLLTQATVYPGLKYLHSQGHFHVFKLPVKHPGHESFQGCSGAPIVDTNGKIVALVSEGCEQDDLVYGINMNKYKFSLDFYCREIATD